MARMQEDNFYMRLCSIHNSKLFYFALPPHPQPLQGRGLRTWADPLQGKKGCGQAEHSNIHINQSYIWIKKCRTY